MFTWTHKLVTLAYSMFPAQCCLISLQAHGSMYLCGCNHECKHVLIAFVNYKGHLLNTVHNDTEHVVYTQSLRLYGRMGLDLMGNLLYLFFFFALQTMRLAVPMCRISDFYSWLQIKHVTDHIETIRSVLSELIPRKFKVCVSLNDFRIRNWLSVYFLKAK